MTIDILQGVLGWCAVINLGVLIIWFLLFVFAHDWMYRMHNKWFKIPTETFDAIHYAGMAFLKMAIIVFNIIPYLALLIVG